MVLPSEGVSSPALTLESNQLIPACGGYLVKLSLWPDGLKMFHQLIPEYDTFSIGDAVRSSAFSDLPPQKMKRYVIGKGWKVLSIEKLMVHCGFKGPPTVVRIPPQVFPRERGDLAREQARRIALVGKANSQEGLRQMLVDEPTQELEEEFKGIEEAERSVHVVSLDVVIDPIKGDLMKLTTQAFWIDKIRKGYISAIVAGPPCETWSVARGRAIEGADNKGPRVLRTVEHPWGLPSLGLRDLEQLYTGTALLLFVIECVLHMFICEHLLLSILQSPRRTRRPSGAFASLRCWSGYLTSTAFGSAKGSWGLSH